MASVYRQAATRSSGVDEGWGTRVKFHRRDCFDAVVALAAMDSYPVGEGW